MVSWANTGIDIQSVCSFWKECLSIGKHCILEIVMLLMSALVLSELPAESRQGTWVTLRNQLFGVLDRRPLIWKKFGLEEKKKETSLGVLVGLFLIIIFCCCLFVCLTPSSCALTLTPTKLENSYIGTLWFISLPSSLKTKLPFIN